MVATAELLERIRPIRVSEFHRLVESGILAEDERVELMDGVLLAMTPVNPPHVGLVKRVSRSLLPLEVSQAAILRQEAALVLSDRDEVYPDLCLVRFREDDYATLHPTVADTFLVIEVSDTTLRADRKVKLPRFALAGIPEVWIANIPDRQMEIYRQPLAGQYQSAQQVPANLGGKIAPLAFPDLQLDLADLFRYV